MQLIMAGHEGEREDAAQARALFLEGGDVAGALKHMPRHQTVEHTILEVTPCAVLLPVWLSWTQDLQRMAKAGWAVLLTGDRYCGQRRILPTGACCKAGQGV